MELNQSIDTFSFTLKTSVKFGVGISKNLGNILSESGYKKIGVIIECLLDKRTFVLVQQEKKYLINTVLNRLESSCITL